VRPWLVLAFLLTAGTTGLTTSPEAAAPLRARAAHGVCSKYKVGALTRAKLGKVRVDGIPRNATWPLRARQRVRATPNAAGWICVKKKGTKCQLWNGGAVTVAPGNGILRFDAEEVSCSTTKTKNDGRFPTKNGAVIRTHDPIFVVVVRPRKTVVKVTRGLVKVTGHGKTVAVGPKEQVAVRAHAAPSKPVASVLTQHQKNVTAALGQELPKRDYVPPSANDSATVLRIYQRGTIQVGIDSTARKVEKWGSSDAAFSERYFSFLADRWNVGFSKHYMSPAVGTRELADETIDVYVTSALPSQPPQLWAQPFVENPDNSVWRILGLADDDVFRMDVRAFLLQSVQQDDYGAVYRAVFGRPPRYEIFGPGA
jgi:hypothetical protein